MDAKKASQVMKPIYFKDTNSFKLVNWVFVGVLGFSVIMGALTVQIRKNNPDGIHESSIRKFLRKYFQSEEWLRRNARIQGISPSAELLKMQTSERVNPIARRF